MMRTSQILGINRRTLYRKEREYGFISPERADSENDILLENPDTDEMTTESEYSKE